MDRYPSPHLAAFLRRGKAYTLSVPSSAISNRNDCRFPRHFDDSMAEGGDAPFEPFVKTRSRPFVYFAPFPSLVAGS